MQNSSVGFPEVTVPSGAIPTSDGSAVRLPMVVNVEVEDLVHLSVEASKLGASVDDFIGTLIQVGLDKWRATAPALA